MSDVEGLIMKLVIAQKHAVMGDLPFVASVIGDAIKSINDLTETINELQIRTNELSEFCQEKAEKDPYFHISQINAGLNDLKNIVSMT